MFPLRKVQSVEDRGERPAYSSSEIRARSSSPCKNKRMSKTISEPFDIFANAEGSPGLLETPLTQEQLMKLSRSPIANRLHITKADYAIPIPFTLQLPPRLSKSAPNSPKKDLSSPFVSPKKSPTRLLFSGSGYEPALSGSSSESESDTSREYSRYSMGQKPPSVTKSRKKVAKFVEKSQAVPADQLSIIEENSTRTNSVKSKILPVLPDSINEFESKDRMPMFSGARGSCRKLLRRPPPDLVLETSHTPSTKHNQVSYPLHHGSTECSNFVEKKMLEPKHYVTGELTNMAISARSRNELALSQNQQQHLQISSKSNPISHTEAVRHSLNYDEDDSHQKTKRNFSDESHVSSVSSFSSFGDIMSIRFNSTQDPAEGALTGAVLRQSSVMTTSSANSWNSLQRSLDLSLKNTLSGMSPRTPAETEKELPNLPLEYIEDKTIEIAPLTVSKMPSNRTPLLKSGDELKAKEEQKEDEDEDEKEDEEDDEEEEVEEEEDDQPNLTIQSQDEWTASSGSMDYNNGDGQSFSFPNNLNNVTNSADVKLKSQRKFKHNSSYSLVTPTGHIEIPDLNENSQYHTKHHLSRPISQQTMEPIGLPSKAAREHFKMMCGGLSTDSDDDSSFNSQFSKMQGSKIDKKKPYCNNLDNKNQTPSISSMSPVRHSRCRSMYDISFESNNIDKSSIYKYAKPKSIMDIPILQNMLGGKVLDKSMEKIQRLSENQPQLAIKSDCIEKEDQNTNEDETLGNIVVAEPPAKVLYPVDFRSALSFPKKTPKYAVNHGQYYDPPRISSEKHKYGHNSISNPESEQASSYHSSHTAGETLSTAPTETGSVLIDLTKDEYDVCMIKRHDSTTSYKSVIEKTKDGQKVEVVLVDEDEEPSYLARDDLLSIYSRYMGTWGSDEMRKVSARSYASDSSEASTESWAASESNFRLKTNSSGRNPLALTTASHLRLAPTSVVKNSARTTENEKKSKGLVYPLLPQFTVSPGSPAAKRNGQYYADVKARPQVPRTVASSRKTNVSRVALRVDNNYFDYSYNPTYDLNSFIHQRNPRIRPN